MNSASEAVTPHPDLSPAEVVECVLAALKHNDHPDRDAGVATLYAFASARLQAQVGALDTFERLLHSDLYAPLLNHRALRREPLERRDHAARQVVVVTGLEAHTEAHTETLATPYLFSLVLGSAQLAHPAAPCWLLSGVARADLLGRA